MIPPSLLQKLAALSADDIALVEALVDYLPSGALRRWLQSIDAARAERGGAGPARARSDGPDAHKAALVHKVMIELAKK